jgi:alanine transaminase
MRNFLNGKKLFSTYKSVLTMDTINQNLIKSRYEVRGGVVIRADELRKEMEKGKKLPFESTVQWNIGNPQALGQLPITFPREVLGCLYSGTVSDTYGKDAINRAKTYKKEIHNIESYTYYKGLNIVRDNVAKFITKRDNCETIKENILLSNGASGGIKAVLQALLEEEKDTILAPIPQYPLYSACIQLLGSTLAGYHLDEDNAWGVDIQDLNKAYKTYYDKGHRLKAMVIINPGNPTGNILSEENIRDIIKFCYDNKLVILADEVYQSNIYSKTKQFHSFKKVMNKMPHPYNKTILFSFHSVSKGYLGECGLRGGYTDMHNVPDPMIEAILKLKGLEICPNVVGQITVRLNI